MVKQNPLPVAPLERVAPPTAADYKRLASKIADKYCPRPVEPKAALVATPRPVAPKATPQSVTRKPAKDIVVPTEDLPTVSIGTWLERLHADEHVASTAKALGYFLAHRALIDRRKLIDFAGLGRKPWIAAGMPERASFSKSENERMGFAFSKLVERGYIRVASHVRDHPAGTFGDAGPDYPAMIVLVRPVAHTPI